MKIYTMITLAALSAMSFGQLWNQANMVSAPGAGTGGIAGGDLMQLEAGATTLGVGSQGGTINNKVADDFTVSAGGWNVTALRFFTYQTGATAPTITGGTFWITNDLTNLGTANNFAVSSTFTNVYRVSGGSTTDGTRRIQQVDVTGLNINLAAGNQFLVWSLTGTSASGPWTPALPLANATFGQNAQQSLANAAFAPLVMGGQSYGIDLPFQIYGEAVPEPATMTILGLGAAALVARRRKQK